MLAIAIAAVAFSAVSGPATTCDLYEVASDSASCGQSTLDCKYESYAKAFQKGLKDGTCAAQGYTVAGATKTISVPFLGDITVTTYTKATVAVEAPETNCDLYEVASDSASCGQSTLDCKYESYAKAFQKGLKDGTCAAQGYTVAGATKTISVPFLGDITVTTYTKSAAVATTHNLTAVAATGGCAAGDLNQICQSFDHLQGDVQGCALKCIISGTSCMSSCVKGLGFTDTCAGCWVDLASCSKSSCVWDCLNPASSSCKQCAQTKCFPGLLSCSGVACNQLPGCESDSSKSNIPGCTGA